MGWWSRLWRADPPVPVKRSGSVTRQPGDPAILDVRTSDDEISIRLAGGVDPAAQPAAAVAWTIEHYRLCVTNGGMRGLSAAESETLVDANPDLVAGLTELRVFGYPLVLARRGQRYAALFDTVRIALADIPQPMPLSRYQQVQKAAVGQVIADMQDRTLSHDEQAALHNLRGMTHWSY